MRRIAPPARGLTLVELLGALLIAALLMAPLAALFRDAANSSVSGHAALDLNDDLRFALDRIARRIAISAAPADPEGGDYITWLGPVSYAVSGSSLVETDISVTPVRKSVIAANVSSFALSAPALGAGAPLMRIDLTLAANGASVQGTRIVRVGGPQP